MVIIVKCDSGFYGVEGQYCNEYSRTCDNGSLIKLQSRTEDNHSGSCNTGYKLNDKKCKPYGGSCKNGKFITQSSRTEDNHCGSCNSD